MLSFHKTLRKSFLMTWFYQVCSKQVKWTCQNEYMLHFCCKCGLVGGSSFHSCIHKHTHRHTHTRRTHAHPHPSIPSHWPVTKSLEPFWCQLVINLQTYWDSWLPSCTPALMQMTRVLLRGAHTHRNKRVWVREACGKQHSISTIIYISRISHFSF